MMGKRIGRTARCGLLVAWISLPSAAAADPGAAAIEPYRDAARGLETWIAREMESKAIRALSIALVDEDRVVWARGFGLADAARPVPATADTVYRVGSISKLFTDLAVMQLVEQGKLDLDGPVDRILPEFAPRNPFDVPITLRHLMSHRSGLVREPPVGHYFDPAPPPLMDVVRSLSRTELISKPGTSTKYSNAGITVVGAVVERVTGMPFARAIERSIFKPLAMAHSSFDPGPALVGQMAAGQMWTYDGQTIATPTFLLGTGPAGNMVSTVADLGRFVSMVSAQGRGASGTIVKPATLEMMLKPQFGKGSQSPVYGFGFAVDTLDGHRRIGHSGAIYGFASDLEILPDDKLGAIVIATADCANGAARRVAETALRQMLAIREHRPPPALESTRPITPEKGRAAAGRYVGSATALDLEFKAGKLFLSPYRGSQRVELRALGDALLIDDRLAAGTPVRIDGERVLLDGVTFTKTPAARPAASPPRWDGLIGEYGWDHDVLYILEKGGHLHALIEWFFDYPLTEVGPDRFRFPDTGLYMGEGLVFRRDQSGRATEVMAAGVAFRRRALDGEGARTFRITPRRPVETIRAEIASARPPVETGRSRQPDLVELTALDPTIKLEIRYATTNNFLGVPLYTQARAFMQRPAAEALVRAHKALANEEFGLLIHDAYRPWHVTKLFWEATPDSGRGFVADPAKGSKHNRGAAVDLSLYDRKTGLPVKMVGGYERVFTTIEPGLSRRH